LKWIKTKHWAPLELQYESKIIKDSVGRYYLATSLPLEPLRNASDEFKNVIALDPGIRTFLTGYGIHGKGIAFGKGGMKNIFQTLYLSDKLNSIVNKKENGNYQYNHRKRQN
jgi:transposase